MYMLSDEELRSAWSRISEQLEDRALDETLPIRESLEWGLRMIQKTLGPQNEEVEDLYDVAARVANTIAAIQRN